jgi:hypothetical protein
MGILEESRDRAGCVEGDGTIDETVNKELHQLGKEIETYANFKIWSVIIISLHKMDKLSVSIKTFSRLENYEKEQNMAN